MNKRIQRIFWGDFRKESFVHGSLFQKRAKDKILFENRFLPSGTPIHEWYSKTNYQAQRESAQLSLLEIGKEYELKANLKVESRGDVFLKIICYDRYDEIIETFILEKAPFVFTYPESSYSYKIQLVSAGCEKLTFSYIDLNEVKEFAEDEEEVTAKGIDDYYFTEIIHRSQASHTLNLIFTEPQINGKGSLSPNYYAQINNVIVGNSPFPYAHLYFDSVLRQEFVDFLKNLVRTEKFRTINFIGYAPISNFAALYYGHKLVRGRSFITTDFYSARKYYGLGRDLFKNLAEVMQILDRREEDFVNYHAVIDQVGSQNWVTRPLVDQSLLIAELNN